MRTTPRSSKKELPFDDEFRQKRYREGSLLTSFRTLASHIPRIYAPPNPPAASYNKGYTTLNERERGEMQFSTVKGGEEREKTQILQSLRGDPLWQ